MKNHPSKALKLMFIFLCSCFQMININAQNCATPGKDGGGNISGVVNTYYPGNTAALAAGSTTIVLGVASGSATPITSGDLLLIIQTQGADIGFSNNNTYGDNVAGAPASGYLNNANLVAGTFEYVVATNNVALTGGSLTILTATVNAFSSRNNIGGASQGQARYQVVRVPQYSTVTVSTNIQALHWNGAVGGVIALDVAGVINFNGFTIDASGSGFRGGGGRSLGGGAGANTDYLTLSTNNANGQKGEGIAGTPAYIWDGVTLTNAGIINTSLEGYPNGSSGRGAPGNGGGGATDGSPAAGNNQNAGGGGGSNGGVGGNGGNSWSSNLVTGGYAGAIFAQAASGKLVMGGGGGAGSANNSATSPYLISGTSGGGIVLIRAGKTVGTGTINVNGKDGLTVVSDCCADGGGGAGAGGSVLIVCANTIGLNGITVTAGGGKGGNSNAIDHGPGGGGGGGIIYSNGTLNVSSTASGGASGNAKNAGIFYGATAGSTGTITQLAAVDPLNQMVGYECIAPPIANNITAPVENNFYGQTPIPSLSGSDAYGTIDSFTINTIPSAVQGILYLCNPACSPVTAGQKIVAADQAKFKFDPAPAFLGNASFIYSAINSQNNISNNAVYVIPVNNQPPLADNILSQVLTNTAGSKPIPALAAADPDGTVTSYTITSIPSSVTQGSLYLCNPACALVTVNQVIALADIGKLQFSPLPTFTGTAAFKYTAKDNSGVASVAATYSLPVKGIASINLPPLADNIVSPPFYNSSAATLIPALSGHDADGIIASYTIETIPSALQGGLTYCSNGTNPCTGIVTAISGITSLSPALATTLKFMPFATFSGTANFTYSSTDNSNNKSNIAAYQIPVLNVAPVANPITTPPMANTLGQTGIPPLSGHNPAALADYTITTIPSVASGSLYLCNPTCTAVTAGQVILPADIAKFTFDPAAGFAGTANFNYTVTDNNGTVSQPALYTVPVFSAAFPTNLPPVANNISSVPIPNTNGQTVISSLSGSDPDGTVSTYTISTIPSITEGTLYLCNPVCAVITSGMQVSIADAANLKFAPAAGYSGNALFNYTATDNNGKTGNIATFTIPVTTLKPQANNVETSAMAATAGPTPILSLVGFETGGTITGFVINSIPSASSGVLSVCNPSCTAITAGQLIAIADTAKLQFAPLSTYAGIYSQFNYTAINSNGVISNTATYTIPLTVGIILPINLLQFTVEKRQAYADIHWATADEINVNRYIVERSIDGINFVPVVSVAAKEQSQNNYFTTDDIHTITSPVIFYRLNMIDNNGSNKYSPVIALKLNGKIQNSLSVSPNPVAGNINIHISSDAATKGSVKVLDALGQVIYNQQTYLTKGENLIIISNKINIAKGVYALKAAIGKEIITTKFLVD